MMVGETPPDGPHVSTVIAGLSLAFALVMALVLGVVAVNTVRGDDQWTPLGPFPTQTVKGTTTYPIKTDTAIVEYPAVSVNDDSVRVTGTKCYQERVQVQGAVSWSSVEPPGLNLNVGEGTNEFEKGCVETSYVNLIPPTVKTWANQRFAEGAEFVLIRISGRQTAFDDQRESVPLTWRTETFAILPAESG